MEAAGTPVLVSVDGNDAKLLYLDLGQDFAIIKQTIASHFNVAQIPKISFLVTSYGVGPVSTELGADTLPLARLEPHLVFRATSGADVPASTSVTGPAPQDATTALNLLVQFAKRASAAEIPKRASAAEIPKTASAAEIPKTASAAEIPKTASAAEIPKTQLPPPGPQIWEIPPEVAAHFRTTTPRFLVRDCYPTAFDKIQSVFMAPSPPDLLTTKTRVVVLSGTPGIGKSLFFVYWFVRQLASFPPGGRVLYLQQQLNNGFLYADGLWSRIAGSQIKNILTTAPPADARAPPLFIVADSVDLASCVPESHRVLVITTARMNWTLKFSPMQLYLPLWSYEELTPIFPESPELKKLFTHYGGIARLARELQCTLSQEEFLARTDQAFRTRLDGVNPNTTVDALANEFGDPDQHHHIFQIFPSSSLERRQIRPGTPYLRCLVKDLLRLKIERTMAEFALRKTISPQLARLQGDYFEDVAHSYLSKLDCQLEAQALLPSPHSLPLRFTPHPARVFKTPGDVVPSPDAVYWIPSQANFPAIDALFYPDPAQPPVFFQMTTAATHPIKNGRTQQFKKLAFALGCREPISLVFVVPAHMKPYKSQVVVNDFLAFNQYVLYIEPPSTTALTSPPRTDFDSDEIPLQILDDDVDDE
ncbi:hypothetical protein PAPYR_7754 [Paratrimastix pyriformis]|uniref:Uncharacterized protein n=1 Tax=Paratrimastix pyriformis TaxID=342808 RepID=A0ABQ8UJF6_9EUKA|nr:hypothetical protein PAPYR_7754 [Paratrimastix pyriformis]